jgi:signal transduction histidine kinase
MAAMLGSDSSIQNDGIQSDGPSRGSQSWRLAIAYVALYAFAYLAKPEFAFAAIWPAHAASFAAYVLMPARRWPLVAFGMLVTELLIAPLLAWVANVPPIAPLASLGFACANILTTLIPAALARAFGLFRGEHRLQVVVSPVWILALFGGALPGSLLGAAIGAYNAGRLIQQADLRLWLLAAVLAMVAFGPMVFGMVRGFSEPARASAQPWEGWAICGVLPALALWFALEPWPAPNEVVEPMLFAIPLVWLALRFSHRTTSIAVAIVASGVAVLAGHRQGASLALENLAGWRNIVISIDMFLLIGCGGALLVNVMTLRQRALLEELAREHAQLRHYAQALDSAEEAARRATAADLHDGVGQVLAGQSMTLAAMRAHAPQPKLAALVEEALEASREAQDGLRLMIQDLSPPELEHASLEETLKWLADLFMTRFQFTVACRVGGGPEPHRDLMHLVYRCIRELLMNACKHSGRKSATVDVELSSHRVDITVTDEGVGFDARGGAAGEGRRFGLAQLRERVRAAAGTLWIDTAVRAGCRVMVRLPR